MLSKFASRGGVSRVRSRAGLATQHARGMAYKAPMREMQFLLNEVYDSEKHYEKMEKSGGHTATPDMVDMILQESAKFAENELAPINEGADRVGCKQVGPNEVTTPPGFKDAYLKFVEGGWQGLSFPEEFGGQGMPNSLALIQSEITSTANWTWTMFPGLSKGAINTLISHGDKLVQSKYLEKLVSGEWTGTMCLTEPHCGSDLAQVSTKAVPTDDGKYKISGTKIFISCGEHDFTDNILHCVLARLPDAPPGIKGISLFAVPKFKVEDDGTLTDVLNGATIGRIEEKMGCHGSPTCEINFEDSIGELIGTPNKGMSHMFTFINTSRMGTAIQGLAAAEGSYQNALAYAKDRLAMRSLKGPAFPEKAADPIIVHPAVRSMLLTQKCIAEGGRALIYDCAFLGDEMAEAEANGDHEKAKQIDDRLGFLTPILKGFLTEVGNEAAYHGVQVFGGHGYIASNGQEQIARDVRIASVWEGTTQIQALDLLGRKIMLQKLKPINQHLSGIRSVAMSNLTSPVSTTNGSLRSHGFSLLKAALKCHYLTLRVAAKAASNRDSIGIASEPYLMFAGYLGLAEQWLKMEAAAAKALDKDPSGPDADFYKGKILASKFYFENILPRIDSLEARILADPASLMEIKPDQF
mmetsp:Transcript_6548/g.12077  ORF Transcript_6548/g.12077 Transcript_6548/m.12077 type:complete len:639 (+) Transcript_6548:86-2002(+)